MLRKAKVTDIKELLRLYEALNKDIAKLDPMRFQGAQMDEEWVVKEIQSNDTLFLVYEEDKEVVGFALANVMETPPYPMYKPKRYGYILDLVVAKNMRGQGIATQLIEGMIEWKSKKNLDYLELNVLANNREARALYKKKEFCESDVRMIYF